MGRFNGADPHTGEIPGPRAADPVSFMKMAYSSVGLDPNDIPAATHWPSVSAAKAGHEWEQLRKWVERLQQRFEFLDGHVIPACWWRHNGHVEALVALRDHERVSYGDLAPATGPVEWLRALRDVAALLRSWTGELACGPGHRPAIDATRPFDAGEWDAHLRADVARREQANTNQPVDVASTGQVEGGSSVAVEVEPPARPDQEAP